MGSDSAPVNDSQRRETKPVRFFQISFHCVPYVARGENMQVKNIADRDCEWLFVCQSRLVFLWKRYVGRPRGFRLLRLRRRLGEVHSGPRRHADKIEIRFIEANRTIQHHLHG